MTDSAQDRIAAIRGRLAAATPGPWAFGWPSLWAVNDGTHPDWAYGRRFPPGRCSACADTGDPPLASLTREGGTWHVHAPRARALEEPLSRDGYAPDDTEHREHYPWRTLYSQGTYTQVIGGYDHDAGGVASHQHDAELIVHAPDDLAWALGALEKTRAELALARAEVALARAEVAHTALRVTCPACGRVLDTAPHGPCLSCGVGR